MTSLLAITIAIVPLRTTVDIPLPTGGFQRVQVRQNQPRTNETAVGHQISLKVPVSGPGPTWSVQWSTNLTEWTEQSVASSREIVVWRAVGR